MTSTSTKNSKTRARNFMDARFDAPYSELVVKGKLGNAYKYPHPNARLIFDEKSSKAITNAVRVESIKQLYIFPHHHSFSENYLAFMDMLSVRLSNEFKPNVDESTGYCFGNAVRGNFYGLRHVPGVPMTPATYTLISNRHRREALKLARRPLKDWHYNLMLAWWINVIQDIKPTDLAIPRGTSSCAPEFTSKVSRKMEIAREAFRDAEVCGNLMLKGDYASPWIDYKMGGAVYIVYRLQVTDKVAYDPKTRIYTPKGRWVADLDYALSGGLEGELKESDKTKYVKEIFAENGIGIKNFFSCRKRTAAGAPLKLNSAIGVIADAMRQNMYDKYGITYHDRTREQKTRDVHEFDMAILADVADHDLLWGEYNLEIMIEAFKICGFADWWIALFHRSMTLPQYVTSLSSEDGNTLIGEWDKPNPLSMLLSGSKFTDICGTGGMTPIYAIGQIEHTAPHHIPNLSSLSKAILWVDNYLKHKLDIAQKSKSDDGLLLFRTPRVVAKAKLLQTKLVHVDNKEGEYKDFIFSNYMIIGYEAGGAYLGDLLYFDSSLDLKRSKFIGNIMSFVNNKFAPEYSCPPEGTPINQYGRYRRKFPGLAWESAFEVYGDCPIFSQVVEVIEDCWSLTIGGSFQGYMNRLLEEDRKKVSLYALEVAKELDIQIASLQDADLTAIDREVLADPSKIHYKFQPDQISTFIHHLLFNKIPKEEVAPYFYSIVQPGEKQCTLDTLRKRLKIDQ
jgi:hypothetical protein